MVANATGCSSIYGGNLPTTPWTTDADGRGPALVRTPCSRTTPSSGSALRLAADGTPPGPAAAELRERWRRLATRSSTPPAARVGVRAQRERVASSHRDSTGWRTGVTDLRSVQDHLVGAALDRRR
jgi:hypothetical protein